MLNSYDFTSITIPKAVTYIGEETFPGNVGLPTIYYMSENPAILDNEGFEFKHCLMANLYVPTGVFFVY